MREPQKSRLTLSFRLHHGYLCGVAPRLGALSDPINFSPQLCGPWRCSPQVLLVTHLPIFPALPLSLDHRNRALAGLLLCLDICRLHTCLIVQSASSPHSEMEVRLFPFSDPCIPDIHPPQKAKSSPWFSLMPSHPSHDEHHLGHPSDFPLSVPWVTVLPLCQPACLCLRPFAPTVTAA